MTTKDAYNIAIAGTEYVGLSLAVLLSQSNHVTAVDIIQDRCYGIDEEHSRLFSEYFNEGKYQEEIEKFFLDWVNNHE